VYPYILTHGSPSGGRAALAIHHCTKPTIGAIQGPAVGIGITMTLPMTIRVGLKSAKTGISPATNLYLFRICESVTLQTI